MRNIVTAIAAALVLAAPAHAEVLQKSDTGFITRTAVEVAKPPVEAWAELIAPAHWWNKAHSFSGDAANLYIDAQAGGCFCELLPLAKDAPEGARRGSVEHMRVIFTDPGKVMRLSGALGPLQGEALTGTLTVTLKPTAKGTRILWEYVVGGYMRFKPDQIAPAVDGVLAEQLARLAGKLGAVAGEDVPAGDAAKPDETRATDVVAPAADAESRVAEPDKVPPASPAPAKPPLRRNVP